LDILFETAFGADAIQVTEEDHLEEDERIDGRTAVVGAVQGTNLIQDKGEVDVLVNFTK